jgi:tRNA dimethylallyltransferase
MIDQRELAPLLERRLDQMMEAGWEEEVRALLAQGVQSSAPAMKAIGYEALQSVVTGLLPRAEALARILVETRQYAKRQRAWMRSEPELHWVGAPSVNGGVPQVQAEIVQKAIKTAGK